MPIAQNWKACTGEIDRSVLSHGILAPRTYSVDIHIDAAYKVSWSDMGFLEFLVAVVLTIRMRGC